MLVEGMDKATYSPRVYVAAKTDKMSANRALSREQTWAGSQVSTGATRASRGCCQGADQLETTQQWLPAARASMGCRQSADQLV
jgi:hypothetical protein